MSNLLQRTKAYFANQFVKADFIRGPINRNDRAGALHKAWGHVFTNHLYGDYFEFGVYQGASFCESIKQYNYFRNWLKAELNSPEAWRREVACQYASFQPSFFGLDTFEGMPDNAESNHTFAGGTFTSNFEKIDQKIAYAANGINYKLFKGLFTESKESLIHTTSNKAAIINIDGDLYQSAVDALDIMKDFIQVGTVILFDDYNCYNANNNEGERKAFSEFCKTSSFEFEKWFSYQFAGQAFLCVGISA